MALTQVNSDGLKDGEVKTADIADQAVDLTKLPHGDGSSDGKFLKSNDGSDPTWAAIDTSTLMPMAGGTFSGEVVHNTTTSFQIPVGSTAQRPGSPSTGDMRFNTTIGSTEVYNGSDWIATGGGTPQITQVSPTSFNGASGVTFTIDGEGFETGCTAYFVSKTGTSTAAGSTTRVSANQVTCASPALTVSGEPYSIKVVNTDGSEAFKGVEVQIDAGAAPVWTTNAGSLGSDLLQQTTLSTITVAATDADGQTITYSESGTTVLTGSGTGEMGLTLNSSTGAITGTLPTVTADTTFNFTLAASDGTNTTTRNFSLSVIQYTPEVFWFKGSSFSGTGASDTSVVSGWSHTGNTANSSIYGVADNDKVFAQVVGQSNTYAGFYSFMYTDNKVDIPADHDTYEVVVTNYAVSGWSVGSSFVSTQPSGGTGGTTAFGDETFSGNGTITGTIPSGNRGNDYYFQCYAYGGQNVNNSFFITKIRTYKA